MTEVPPLPWPARQPNLPSVENSVTQVEVRAEEVPTACKVPAFNTDKLVISLTGDSVRITFAELRPQHGKVALLDSVDFQKTVTLSQIDGVSLHRVLRELLWPIEMTRIDQKL